MNGLALPPRPDPSFAPIYDSMERPAEWRRCRHVSVLRQRYETLTAVDLAETTHDLGYAQNHRRGGAR